MKEITKILEVIRVWSNYRGEGHFSSFFQILGGSHFVDKEWNRRYVLSTESSVCGGFSKWPDCHPGII